MKNSVQLSLIGLLAMLTSVTWAQRGHGSLYSYFGPGTFHQDNFGMAKRLGGVGSGVRSPYFLNNVNPASQNSLEVPFTFLFEAEASYQYLQTETGSETVNSNFSNLNTLQFWMRISPKTTLSIGIAPVTTKDYSFSDEVSFEGLSEQYERIHRGWGNVNKVYVNAAWELGDRVSLGLRPSFVFANFQESTTYLNVNEAGFRSDRNQNLSGAGLEAGLQWEMIRKSDLVLTWGVNSQHYTGLWGTEEGDISTQVDNLVLYSSPSESAFLALPHQIRSGWGLQTSKFLFATDVLGNFGKASTDQNEFSWGYSAGVEWIPDYRKPGFFNSMSFSLGGRYESGLTRVADQDVASYALNSGVGFQLNRATRINLGYQYQVTGKVEQMARESVHGISLFLSFGDRWFQRYSFE